MLNRDVVPKGRNPDALYCDEPSMTKQSFTNECDINEILRRSQNGLDVNVSSRPGQYGDFTNIPDYREAFDIVNRAQGLFMDMPWQVRERFSNNPEMMIKFLTDPANRDEAVKLGLVVAPPAPVVDESLSALKSIDESLKKRKSSDL